MALNKRPWNGIVNLTNHLKKIGFNATVTDPCLYVRTSDASYILVYVDDMVIGCKTRETMIKLKKNITSKFPCTDKSPICLFLNMTISRNRKLKTITLSQPTKIKNLLQDNQLSREDLKYISTPSKIPALPSTVILMLLELDIF
jgi:hypothetical protein